MRGVIISTGQCPANGWRRTVPQVEVNPHPCDPRAWVNVSGVEYPAEATPVRRAVGKPLPFGQWVPTAEAAAMLGIGPSSARLQMSKHGVKSLRKRNCLYWQKSAVAKLAEARSIEVLAEVPQGWMTSTDAAKRLGVSRSTLQRYTERRHLRARRAHISPAKRRAVLLINAADVDALLRVREAHLKAERYRLEYEAALAELKH